MAMRPYVTKKICLCRADIPKLTAQSMAITMHLSIAKMILVCFRDQMEFSKINIGRGGTSRELKQRLCVIFNLLIPALAITEVNMVTMQK